MLKAMVAGQPADTHNDMYCNSGTQYEYYPEYYPQHPELCPAHPTLCTVHGDYGPVTVPMVSTNPSPPMAMPVQVPPGHVVQQIVDESGTLRHVILSPQHPLVPMPAPYGSGANQPPQQFYAPQAMPPGYPPPHFGHGGPMQPGVMGHVPPPAQPGHSPPPHNFHKDERTQRQYIKLKKKLEQKQMRGEGLSINSSPGTPPISPRKELVNGLRRKERGMSSVGTSEDGEESSSMQDDEEDHLITEMLSTVKSPQVTELNSRSALLQWTPLCFEGRCAELDIAESDLRYEVLLSDKGKEGKYKSIYNGIALSCRIQDLRPGTEYSVCLQVHLEELQGAASEPTTFTTPACEPDQPQPPKIVNRTRTSLQLRWNAPVDNGSHITQYILEFDEGKGSGFVEIYKSRGKQHNLTKLQQSTCYKLRLAAVNDKGRSPYSEVVQYSTAGSPPSQPASPTLREASVTSLHLAWQKRPADDDFILQMEDRRSGHGFLPVYNGKDLHYVCEGLHRHTEFKFRLRAHNEEGHSRWSDEVCYRTLPDRPAAPCRPVVKGHIHAQSFKMKWDPPVDTGGADITAYVLELNEGSGYKMVYTGPETKYVCDHLTPGSTYQVRVACISSGGRSDYSEPCTVTTEAVCPGQCSPPRVHGKPRSTTLALKWSYPEYDGGSPLSQFEVEMTSPDSGHHIAYQGTDTECMVTDLSPGQTYVFRVRAVNRVGAGMWSDSLEVESGAAPPNTPREPLVACRSPHHALVQWEEPASNGAAISDYRLEMSTTENEQDFSAVFQGLSTSYDMKGLAAATAYYFRVQAGNSAGWSAVSGSSQVVTPPSVPALVPLPSCSASPTTLSLCWQQPANHGADIIHYNIDLSDHSVATPGPDLEHTLESLQPDTTYRLRVQAVNSVGAGPFSPVLKVTTLPLPPAPPRLECTNISHNSLKLKWGESRKPDFTQFTVEMENSSPRDSFHTVYKGTSLSCKVSRLHEMTTYRFRIRATNDAGQGDFSDVYEFTTCIAPPPSIKPPKVSDVQQRSCSVEWSACKPMGSDPLIYHIQLARRDQEYKLVLRMAETRAQLSDLEPGTEYHVRVCPVRQTSSADLPGAFSPSTTFSTTAPEPVAHTSSRASVSQVSEKKPLTDEQWAMIILAGFTLFALAVAALMHWIMHLSNSGR